MRSLLKSYMQPNFQSTCSGNLDDGHSSHWAQLARAWYNKDQVGQNHAADKLINLLSETEFEGYKPICDFLQIADCPSEPYPRVNDTKALSGLLALVTLIAYGWPFIIVLVCFILARRCLGCGKANKKSTKKTN